MLHRTTLLVAVTALCVALIPIRSEAQFGCKYCVVQYYPPATWCGADAFVGFFGCINSPDYLSCQTYGGECTIFGVTRSGAVVADVLPSDSVVESSSRAPVAPSSLLRSVARRGMSIQRACNGYVVARTLSSAELNAHRRRVRTIEL